MQDTRSVTLQEKSVPPSSLTGSEGYISEDIDILVAGSVAVDISCDYTPLANSETRSSPRAGTSNPAKITQTVGGVGFNVARAASLAGAKVQFCSMVGSDDAGKSALDAISQTELEKGGVHVRTDTHSRTAQYVAVNDLDKNLNLAMADMGIFEQQPTSFEEVWEPHLDALGRNSDSSSQSKWLVVDANWDSSTLHQWLQSARSKNIKTAFEPVSFEKTKRLFEIPKNGEQDYQRLVDLASPNALELVSMVEAAQSAGWMESQHWWEAIDALGIPATGARSKLAAATSDDLVDDGIPQMAIRMLPFVPCLTTKLGPKGVLITRILQENDELLNSQSPWIVSRSKIQQGGIGGLYMRLISPERILNSKEIRSVNGAGDTFLGALIAHLISKPNIQLDTAVQIAHRASLLTLASSESMGTDIPRAT